jgi:hypothetical protein
MVENLGQRTDRNNPRGNPRRVGKNLGRRIVGIPVSGGPFFLSCHHPPRSHGLVIDQSSPVECRIDDLDDPRSELPRGVSVVVQTDCGHPRFVVVCRNSMTPRNRGFREVCTHLPFRTRRCGVRVRYNPL